MEHLTSRVKSILLKFVNQPIPAAELLLEIKGSAGMGSFLLNTLPEIEIKDSLLFNAETLVLEGYYQSIKLKQSYVGTEHLLLALLKLLNSEFYAKAFEFLAKLGSSPIAKSASGSKLLDLPVNLGSPVLDSFGTLLNTSLAGKTDLLVERSEISNLYSILLQKSSPNCLIVGDEGVGKKTLVNLLVKDLNNLNVPPFLVGYRVIEFDIMAYIASLLNKGVANALIDELNSSSRIILYLKNFQSMFVSNNSGISVPFIYSMLKNSFDTTNNNVILLATMTSNLFEKISGENDNLLDSFTTLFLEEPDAQTNLAILKSKSALLGEYHNLSINDSVLKYILEISRGYNHNLKQPEKSIKLLDQSCTKLLVKKTRITKKYKALMDKIYKLEKDLELSLESGMYDTAESLKKTIKKTDNQMFLQEETMFNTKNYILETKFVDQALADSNNEPLLEDSVDLRQLKNLASQLKEKIIGQDSAVESVAKALIRSKLGLRSSKRPVANFLFLGPTGVGKTQLAKELSLAGFGPNSLIRLDMSDFAEKHNVARLVGAPPGYVGYGEGGELTSKIEENPHSLVLFDEIEKAHPDVLNILLQILEEGELSDAKGNKFDFSKAVIILTSNLGTEILHKNEIGFGDGALDDSTVEVRLKENVKKVLKPELINRLDEVIIFKRLNKVAQLKVLHLLLNEVKEKLKSQSIQLKISADVKNKLLEVGYSHEYGARSLRRTIETNLLDKIAEVLLVNKKRPLKLTASLTNNSIVVR